MIELERDESQDIQVWADADFSHVIVQETEDTVRVDIPMEPGWYVRDEDGESGPFLLFVDALDGAADRGWDVTLGPANRLVRDMTNGDETDAGPFLVQYLATYGPVGIDVQALANLALTRLEEE